MIDFDQQRGCLSHLLCIDDNRSDPDADTIVHHMVSRPQGEFEDLIRTTEGIDVVETGNVTPTTVRTHQETLDELAV